MWRRETSVAGTPTMWRAAPMVRPGPSRRTPAQLPSVAWRLDDSTDGVRPGRLRPIGVPRQVAVEQDVAAHPEHAIGWTPAVAQPHVRRQPDGRPPLADEHWCDGDLQPIEQIGLEKRGHGHAAAFDEHAGAAAGAQQPQRLRRLLAALGTVDGRNRRTADMRLAGRD